MTCSEITQLNTTARRRTPLQRRAMPGEHRDLFQGQRAPIGTEARSNQQSSRGGCLLSSLLLDVVGSIKIGTEPRWTSTAERSEGRLSLSLFPGASKVKQMWGQMPGADGQQRLEPLQPVGPSQSLHCRTGWVDGQQRSGPRSQGCGGEFWEEGGGAGL